MKKLRVAAVQMNSLIGQTAKNLTVMGRYAKAAAKKKVQLVLFPELCLQGHWVSSEVFARAEPVPGPSVRRVERWCRDLGIYVSFGMAARQDNVIYNAQVLVGPKGHAGTSCKLHMSGDEFMTYRGGDSIPVFDIGLAKLGQVVCYDNDFPEVARSLAVNGAEVILMPHAGRGGQWKTVADERKLVRRAKQGFLEDYAMRAKENATYCVVTNQVGRGGFVDLYPRDSSFQPHHAGGVIFFDPAGQVIAESKTDRIEDELVVADLDPDRLLSVRGSPNFPLRNRRPDLYAALTRSIEGP